MTKGASARVQRSRRAADELVAASKAADAAWRSSPGAGGGIRLDSAMDTDSSVHNRPALKPISLNGQRITRGLLCCGIIGALAIGHVQLRFGINDGRLQHQRMQRIHRELLQDYARLERGNAQLSDYHRLHEYAVGELHMIEVRERPTAYITADLQKKYDGSPIVHASNSVIPKRAIADAVSKFGWVNGDDLMKLVDSGRAALAGQARP